MLPFLALRCGLCRSLGLDVDDRFNEADLSPVALRSQEMCISGEAALERRRVNGHGSEWHHDKVHECGEMGLIHIAYL